VLTICLTSGICTYAHLAFVSEKGTISRVNHLCCFVIQKNWWGILANY